MLILRTAANATLNYAFKSLALFQLYMFRRYHKKHGSKSYTDYLQKFSRCRLYTLAENKKLMSLYSVVNLINERNLDGDFVECGVWRGGCCMLMALTQLNYTNSNGLRNIYMYDTFTGMTSPGKNDPWFARFFKGMGAISQDEVLNNMLSTNYPQENIFIVKGDVRHTIPEQTVPEKIVILRLDTDFYESTKHELEHLYPRIVRGGALIVDDYYTFSGSKKAFHEYMDHKGLQIKYQSVGTGIIAFKE